MNKIHFSMLVFALGLFLGACNNSDDPKKQADAVNKDMKTIDNDDSQFMTEATSGGMMEVAAGKIAVQRGISKEVKDFGQQMIEDHSKANDELKGLAMQKNVTIPADLSNDDQKNIDKLNAATDKEFDKTYMDMMVDDHKKDVDAFQKVVDNPKDADVKIWAEKTLPTLKHHLEMARMDQSVVDKYHKEMK